MNRWRVVERGYKKFIDNKNKTGRGKKFFEYEQEMDEMFSWKKNVNPVILLEASTIDIVEREAEVAVFDANKSNIHVSSVERVFVLQKSREDRKEYYNKRVKIEEEKLFEIKR
ncbi:hypothetical protein ABEB36_009227 [Hypothenemus hampei]|uniref:Uncharacterized protein n=1 Tax=Hypothenemus hampei TaxID=57062 RepID=A0ABD1EPL2_HYPHA